MLITTMQRIVPIHQLQIFVSSPSPSRSTTSSAGIDTKDLRGAGTAVSAQIFPGSAGGKEMRELAAALEFFMIGVGRWNEVRKGDGLDCASTPVVSKLSSSLSIFTTVVRGLGGSSLSSSDDRPWV